MPLFVARRLFEPLVPLHLLPILRDLVRFDQLCVELKTHPAGVGAFERSKRLRQLETRHEELLQAGLELLPPGVDLVEDREAVQGFCIGLLLLAHYERTVVAGGPVLDTHGSKVLASFRADVAARPSNVAVLDRAMRRAFSLSDAEAGRVHDFMAHELEELDLRHRIVAALADKYGLHEGAEDLDGNVLRAFDDLYQGHPLRRGEVRLVRTGTSLFFCIPCTETALDPEAFKDRDPSEHASILGFLERIHAFRPAQLGHFPVFGSFRGEAASGRLLDGLVATTRASREDITRALTTMVTVLRAKDVDKYVFHDAWGHQWQSQLLPFEDDFQAMSTFTHLPAPTDRFTTLTGDTTSLLDAVGPWVQQVARGQTPAPSCWDRWLRAAFADRISVAASGLVAEILADVIEYKFLVFEPDRAEDLPSSSLFKEWPTKLDLILLDLRQFFRVALQAFTDLVHDDEVLAELTHDLGDAMPAADPARLAEATAQIRERTGLLLDSLFAPRFHVEATDDGVRINVFTRMALNLLGLHTTLNRTYRLLDAQQRTYPAPVRDFRDLLVLSTGAFYQLDPVGNFWHLDEYLALWFEPCLDKIVQALEAEGTAVD